MSPNVIESGFAFPGWSRKHLKKNLVGLKQDPVHRVSSPWKLGSPGKEQALRKCLLGEQIRVTNHRNTARVFRVFLQRSATGVLISS